MFSFSLKALIEKTRERQAATLSEVTWRGRTVPVRCEQVRVFLLSLQQTEAQLAAAQTDATQRHSILETLLKELIDAQQALREELKDDPVSEITLYKLNILGKLLLRLNTTFESKYHVCKVRNKLHLQSLQSIAFTP